MGRFKWTAPPHCCEPEVILYWLNGINILRFLLHLPMPGPRNAEFMLVFFVLVIEEGPSEHAQITIESKKIWFITVRFYENRPASRRSYEINSMQCTARQFRWWRRQQWMRSYSVEKRRGTDEDLLSTRVSPKRKKNDKISEDNANEWKMQTQPSIPQQRKDLPIVIDYIYKRSTVHVSRRSRSMKNSFFRLCAFVPIHLWGYCLLVCCHLSTIECLEQPIWMAMNENVQLVPSPSVSLCLSPVLFVFSVDRTVGRFRLFDFWFILPNVIISIRCFSLWIFNQKSERRLKENLHLFKMLYSILSRWAVDSSRVEKWSFSRMLQHIQYAAKLISFVPN